MTSMLDRVRRFVRTGESRLLVVLAILVAALAFGTDEFWTVGNFFELLENYSFMGILALGLVVVLISGGIDISFTAIATVAQYLMAMHLLRQGGNWVTVFAIAGGIGLLLGAVNALLVHYTRVPAIIITIATLNVFHGTLIYLTRGKWLYGFPGWFSKGVDLFSFTSGDGMTYSVNLPIVTLIVVLAVTWFILNRTTVGRKIYALGGNPDAAERLGYNILGLHLFTYCYMGLLAGIAAAVQAQIVLTVAPNAIVGRELEVLAAVVLGGASLTGGQGTVLGTVLGVALIGTLSNGLILLGVSSYWHQVLLGVVILVSVSLTAWNAKQQERKRGTHEHEEAA